MPWGKRNLRTMAGKRPAGTVQLKLVESINVFFFQ
jgi:hypothetical protein